MRIPTHPLHALKPHIVPIFPLHSAEAGGMAAGRPQDATDGLSSFVSDSNQRWYWNPLQGEWQLGHVVRSGDTLWQMSKTYYGSFSRSGVHAIHEVPQNLAIQGPNADIGLIPGDVILIPGLRQPNTPPSISSTLPEVTDKPPPPGPPDVTPPGAGSPTTVTQAAPPGWPAGQAWPPTAGGDVMVPTHTTPIVVDNKTARPTTTAPGKFWTPGRIALAGGIGVVGLGTAIYFATRPKRRTNPRRRRR